MNKRDPLQVGEIFEGPSKTLTDAHFLLFSGITGDAHPIHYDVEYAKATRFGKPIAHGLLLASLTAFGATTGRERCEGFIFVEQGCRFLKPAVVGDTVKPVLAVERLWDEGERRYCRLRTSIVNQRGENVIEGFHVYRVLNEQELKARTT